MNLSVSLSRNGWHRKLQEWTFGKSVIRFGSLCPYFWFTIFCVIASPATLFIRSVYYGIKLSEKIINIYILDPLEKSFAVNLTEAEMLQLYTKAQKHDWEKRSRAMYRLEKAYLTRKKLGLTKESWYEYHTRIERLYEIRLKKQREYQDTKDRARYELQRARDKKFANSKKNLDKLVTLITKVTQVVVPILMVGVVAVGGYYLFSWLATFETQSWVNFFKVTLAILGIIVALVIICFIFYFGFKLFRLDKFSTAMAKTFSNSMSCLFENLGEGFGIFGEYALAFKKNYCPMIQWEDKSNE